VNRKSKRTTGGSGVCKCPWCGKEKVRLKGGRVSTHLSPGGVKCIAVGIVYREAVK
jgi:hypothetical protein